MIKVTRPWARALLAAGLVVAMTAGGVISVAPASADARPGRSCERELPVGASTLDVTFAGEAYDVLVQVPEAPLRRELPLVVDLHGSNANGGVQAEISDLGQVGAANGFIVVNPTGDLEFPQTLPDGNWAWNVPGVPLTSGTYPPEGARDDVAFLRAVVDAVDAAGCVDERRVFATGFSGGGRMASALACEASDVFAAIAPVAGLRAGRPDPEALSAPVAASCTPERPVAVVSFHGTADFVNPYPGNSDPRWGYSVQLAAERWAALNECRRGPAVASAGEGITAYSWSHCAAHADVVVYEVAEGGHTWPGTDVDLSALGATTQEINASQTMWEFFKAHPRRG
ncbi:alpha/beta hydrolase family esterase [Microbacterium sp. ZW T6_19]|uniref:alpha/beta hydrolase family esterase n=1 Tax=Microbacterium sp. ZW T6_19 TaxID=3378082 RepID=UPI003851B2B5